VCSSDLDGRPHLPPSIRQWSGDPRGRWDGATLVVDTTNFTGKTSVEGSGARLHVVERFTRTAADALRYEFTIEDPAFARPWSAAWTLTRTAERVFEYACHEGNYSMPMTLAGARAQEREAVAVRVLMSGGFSAAFHALRPELERTADVAITIATGASQGDGPNTIGAQLRRGDAADVVILSREGLDDLIDDGRIARGSDANLAATPLGVAVRAGAPKPDLSSVDAFKQMLLRAGAIAFANSTTGMYLTTKLFPRLGIADEMARKSTTAGVAAVAQGRADVAIQPVSELLHAPGVDFVGPLPREVQYISVFSAAIVAGARHADAGARVIAFLTSPAAAAAIKTSGMDPARR